MMSRFRERMARFFYGRNGADALYQTLMWVALGLMVLHLFLGGWILWVLELLVLVLATHRLLSKNLFQRQKENRAYLALIGRIKRAFKLQREKHRDRKTHVFRQCPQCKSTLRLPRIKGEHTARCPRCEHRFSVKV